MQIHMGLFDWFCPYLDDEKCREKYQGRKLRCGILRLDRGGITAINLEKNLIDVKKRILNETHMGANPKASHDGDGWRALQHHPVREDVGEVHAGRRLRDGLRAVVQKKETRKKNFRGKSENTDRCTQEEDLVWRDC